MSKAYYQEVYSKDETNKKVQSEKDYLDWAINGKPARIWASLVNEILSGLSMDVHSRLRPGLERIGLRAVSEWAKDNNTRAFSEKPLLSWAEELKTARKQDSGDGSLLEEEINRIEGDLNNRILRRGLPIF